MHPNAFLKTLWRLDLKPHVFVAMSFSERFKSRYDNIIAPAIRAGRVQGMGLEPHRIDLNKTGDSMLTEIVEGIAHSQLVLADVSSVGTDAGTGQTYRNGNVMYEVGIALSCRQPEEVLLVRDDDDKFLFDVSTIPHMRLDFANENDAREKLTAEIKERLRLQRYLQDARIQRAVASLSVEEVEVMQRFGLSPDNGLAQPARGTVNFQWMAAIPRLLDKQVIKLHGAMENKHPSYWLTPLGKIVLARLQAHFVEIKVADARNTKSTSHANTA